MKNAPHPQRCRAIVVEDQGMFRAFLERWLSAQPGITFAGAAHSGEEALRLVETAQPDLMIVDLQLPGMNGLEFVRAARQLRPPLRTLILSSMMDPLTLTRVRESGVEGYLEKDASPDELSAALEAVANGGHYYSEKFTLILMQERAKPLALGKILSRREQDVLSHVLVGRTSREISELIGLSPRTVEFHRANIMAKLGATNATELVARAGQRGLS